MSEKDAALIFNIATLEDLLPAANKATSSETTPKHFKESIKLYFIARHLVAYYGAEVHKIPMEVWNEYRNALDHLMRHFGDPERDKKHIKAAEVHLRRAAYDIAKILCYDLSERIEEAIKKENSDHLRLIDAGGFYENIMVQLTSAKEKLSRATTSDSSVIELLGFAVDPLHNYLLAAFEYITLEKYFNSKRPAIEAAAQAVKNEAEQQVQRLERRSFWGHVTASLLAKIIWGVLLFAFALIIAPYLDELRIIIVEFWNSLPINKSANPA